MDVGTVQNLFRLIHALICACVCLILCHFITGVASCKNHYNKVQNCSSRRLPHATLLTHRPPSPPITWNPGHHQSALHQFMILRTVYKWNYTIRHALRFSFPLSIIPLTTSHLLLLSVLGSFLWPSSSSWSGWPTVCLIVHPLKDIWVVPRLGLSRTHLLWAFTQVSVRIFPFLWEKRPRVPWLDCRVSSSLVLRNGQTIFQSG